MILALAGQVKNIRVAAEGQPEQKILIWNSRTQEA
jgi:hypothetical protein